MEGPAVLPPGSDPNERPLSLFVIKRTRIFGYVAQDTGARAPFGKEGPIKFATAELATPQLGILGERVSRTRAVGPGSPKVQALTINHPQRYSFWLKLTMTRRGRSRGIESSVITASEGEAAGSSGLAQINRAPSIAAITGTSPL